MTAASAAILYAILILSILTAWIPQRWPISILEVGAFLLALAWMHRFTRLNQRPHLNLILIPAGFFTAWGCLQLAFHWTLAASETVEATLAWAANLALIFLALQTFAESALRRRFLKGLLWFAFLLCIGAIFQCFSSGPGTFAMGPFLYHNHFAAFVELLLPLALLQPANRLWYAFVSATMIAAVVLSASRAGVALVFLETVLILALARRRAVIVLSITIALTTMIGWDSLAARFQAPNHDRLEMLRSSLEMFRDHPLTGVGLGNWPIVFPAYAHYDDGLFANQAHNDWVQAADEAGLPGLAAFTLLFVLALRQRNIGPVFVLLHAVVDYPFHSPPVTAVLCVMLGVGAFALNSSSDILDISCSPGTP